MKAGHVEFGMPKARVTVEPERVPVELHVFWACAAFAALLAGVSLGNYIDQRKDEAKTCKAVLDDGRRLLAYHLNERRCVYEPPLFKKGRAG